MAKSKYKIAEEYQESPFVGWHPKRKIRVGIGGVITRKNPPKPDEVIKEATAVMYLELLDMGLYPAAIIRDESIEVVKQEIQQNDNE